MSGREFNIVMDINAPPAVVSSVMLDVERWAEWTASISKIERLDAGPLALGSRARVVQPKVPPAVWQVTELDPARGFSWKSGTALAWAEGKHWVEAAGQGSRATLALHFGGPLGGIVGRLLKSINHQYLGMEAAGLKQRSESLAQKVASR